MDGRSAKRALAVAAAYGGVAVVYIVASSALAARLATDVADLHRVERLKGIVFVIVTSVAVFVASYLALRRAATSNAELARQRRLLEVRERQALAGTMAASIAHDANNVLTALLGELDLAVRAHPSLDESLSLARSAANRLVTLNRRLSSAAKQETSVDLQTHDLGALATEIVGELRAHRTLAEREVTVHVGSGPLVARVSTILFHQALTNLVLNAGEATKPGGHVEVRVEAAKDRKNAVAVHVDDDGPGVPASEREEIFSALRTTKASGSGLGLFSTRACIGALGGVVFAGESPLGGARFTVVLSSELT